MADPKQTYPPIQNPGSPDSRPAKRWYPPVFKEPELDLAIKTIYQYSHTLEHTSVQTPPGMLNGSSTASGAITVTGSMKGVASGLSTLSNVVVSIDSGSTPTNMTVTATPSTITPGTFDIYVWQTSLAAATSPMLIRWIAWGT